MKKLKSLVRNQSEIARGINAFLGCALFMLAAFGVIYAQAGRRVQKPKNDPPVQKPEEPAVAVKVKPAEEREKISLLVASNSRMAMNASLNANALFQGAVMQRLRDSKALQITTADNMSRGEANKRAKNDETGTHIVWLELQSNSMGYDPTGVGRTRTEDLQIQFVVLEPKTGKVKAQGNVFLRPTSSARIGGIGIGRSLPRCYPQPMYSVEFSLIEAGIETAERIFNAFSLPNPPLCS